MPITVVLIAETRSMFSAMLSKHYITHRVRSGKKAIVASKAHQAQLIIIDAPSLGTNGKRICKQLRQEFPEKYIIHICPDSVNGAENYANIVLNLPLSTRSLLNAINDLISQKDSKILRCGTFQLDVDRRILIVKEQETALTPKQTALIEIFLCHPNQILEREWLIKQIWRTSYTEDTRTLNVHIRYVRQIMEVDASNPQYIKTVRGKGYRFEVKLPQNKKADT